MAKAKKTESKPEASLRKKPAPRLPIGLVKNPAGVRLYVLDTNVLLHDPTSITRFEEHNVIIPLVVLEELDRHKKGVADIARNARQVTRSLDELMQEGSIQSGFPLPGETKRGRLFVLMPQHLCEPSTAEGLDADKADNQILACAQCLLGQGFAVTLVTKDINLRVKAKAADVPVQDYRNDKVVDDADVLPTGVLAVAHDFFERTKIESLEGGQQLYLPGSKHLGPLPINSFVVVDGEAAWRVVDSDDKGYFLDAVSPNPAVSSRRRNRDCLSPRNMEQTLAMSLLYDDAVDCVALLGPAGTGKTLLAIAAGLEQIRDSRYTDLLITRATVPLGEEIGFLPGTEAEKMGAWLGGTLKDTFDVLNIAEADPLRKKVEVASMSFMRGRSFQNKFILIDEAQNLTIQQMKAMLTRAGEGTKVVLTGNISQIDSPYLDEGSSGLTWAAKHLQGWEHAGSLILQKVERSRLAAFVEALSTNR